MHAADTSVAVPFCQIGHESHDVAVAAVAEHRPVLAGHAAFEGFCVLTRLPQSNRLSPESASTILRRNFGEPCWLTVDGSERVYALLSEGAIAGGAVYDALVAQAALDHERTLLTLDRRAAATYRAVGVDFELLR